MGKLNGKVVVISEAGRDFGRGVALRLGYEGAKVATIGLKEEELVVFQNEMESRGYEAMYMVGDVAKRENVDRFIGKVDDKWGRIDALVNNIVSPDSHSLLEITDEDIDSIFDPVVRSSVYMTQACYPYFKKLGAGKVVNFSSVAAHFGDRNCAAYAVCTAGIGGMTRACAMDWAAENIQVNMVVINDMAPEDRLNINLKLEGSQAEIAQHHYPVRRLSDPETDIGPIVAFLCSDDAHWITARTIFADGGQGSVR